MNDFQKDLRLILAKTMERESTVLLWIVFGPFVDGEVNYGFSTSGKEKTTLAINEFGTLENFVALSIDILWAECEKRSGAPAWAAFIMLENVSVSEATKRIFERVEPEMRSHTEPVALIDADLLEQVIRGQSD